MLGFVGGRDLDPAGAASVAREIAPIARVGYIDAELTRAFDMTPEAGFPLLVRVHKGVIVAAGNTLLDVLS
jgi:hypothetical protein